MPSQIQHQKFTKHCLCPRCDCHENYEELLQARLQSVDKYTCPKCERGFAHSPALEAHQREYRHAYCFDCNIISPTEALHARHIRLHVDTSAKWTLSATEFRCCDCKRDFVDEWTLIDHLRYSEAHGGNQDEDTQLVNSNRCKLCQKNLKSQGALEQHLNSARHKPLSNIKCMAAKNCEKYFSCLSAQLHHLESGQCISGMTMTKLNTAIMENDTECTITSERGTTQRFLSNNSTEFFNASITSSSILSTRAYQQPMLILPSGHTLRLSAQTWPVSSSCLYPPPFLRTANSLSINHAQLQRHYIPRLSPSPVEPDEIFFYGPDTLMDEMIKKKGRKVVKHFSTVSGLAQYVESGACGGGEETLKRVIEYVQDEMEEMGFAGAEIVGLGDWYFLGVRSLGR